MKLKFLEKIIDKYVIVRSYSSGVHFGLLEEYDAETRHAILKNPRRLWQWRQFTLSELSKYGNYDDDNKTSEDVELMMVAEVCEVIPCQQAAIDNFLNQKRYSPFDK